MAFKKLFHSASSGVAGMLTTLGGSYEGRARSLNSGVARSRALLGAVKTAGVARRSYTRSSAQSKAGVARSCYILSALTLLEY